MFKFEELAKFVHCFLYNKTKNSFHNCFWKTIDRCSQAMKQSADCSNLHILRIGTKLIPEVHLVSGRNDFELQSYRY